MSSENESNQIISEVNQLKSKIADLQSKVRLSNLIDQIEDLQTTGAQFHNRVKELRNQGYVFNKNLAPQAIDLGRQWRLKKPEIQRQIDHETLELKNNLKPLETSLSRLMASQKNVTLAKNMIEKLKNECETLESKISAVESSLRGKYDQLETETRKFENELKQLEKLFKNLKEASFSLQPEEGAIISVEATFVEGKEDKNDPKGILYLTDQRLIFERKQEVAKKKVLFIATEKEMLQETIFETAVGYVDVITPSKRGLFKNEDHLEIEFSGGELKFAHLHLYGQDCNDWQTWINNVKSGLYDNDRAVKQDDEVLEKVKDIPTICPACGGALKQQITRGMNTITCEYCGNIIRI